MPSFLTCRNIKIVIFLVFSSASKETIYLPQILLHWSPVQQNLSKKIKRSESAWNVDCKIKCVNFVSASKACGMFRFLKYSLIMQFQNSQFMPSLSLSLFNSRGSCLYICNYNKVWGVFSINELICSWIGFQWIKQLNMINHGALSLKERARKGEKGERRRRGEEYPFARSP